MTSALWSYASTRHDRALTPAITILVPGMAEESLIGAGVTDWGAGQVLGGAGDRGYARGPES
eukprot:3127282-Rhodomonas_salina.1